MKQLKIIIGKILIVIQPKKANELVNRGLSLSIDLDKNERFMRYALLEKVKKNKDYETLSKIHKNFWINKGRDFFSNTHNNLEGFFIPKALFMFDLLQEKLQNDSGKYNMLIEIGTGDGIVLEYLSAKFPQIDRFIGIDLSVSQIEENKIKFNKSPHLEFVAEDCFDWFMKNGEGNMIIFTNNGVLEYFTQPRLESFFKELNRMGKIIFIAIEPTGIDHDLLKNPNSEVYGNERSFSHNYAKIFQNSGFSIWHHNMIPSNLGMNMNFFGAKN